MNYSVIQNNTPASILPIFKLLCLNCRDQHSEKGQSSRAELLQGSSHHKYLGLLSAVSVPRPTDSLGVCLKCMLDIALMQFHDASACKCMCVCSPSRCHGDFVFNAKPYLPLNVNMKNMSNVFESFRNCTFGRLGVDFTMFKWKHKYKIQKGVNTSEGRCHSCQNQI